MTSSFQQQNDAVPRRKHHHVHDGLIHISNNLSEFVHHLHLDTNITQSDLLHKKATNEGIPGPSPNTNISSKWRELHGANDYEGLLNPLDPLLRHQIIKYGEFAQATYDAFDFDSFSKYCGSCRYSRHNLFNKVGLCETGYNVSKYIYSMSFVDVPYLLETSAIADKWSKDSNWMGYVAVSDDKESRRIGRRDIVVAWRGTVATSEWFENLKRNLAGMGHGEVKVERGFLHIYKSKSAHTRYNKSSASEQVMQELTRMVNLYRKRGEEVSLTITGHSLGGALALLNAHEAAVSIPHLPINVISFGAPRVGNTAFKDELHSLGVKTLRVVVKQDVVPRFPGLMLNEGLKIFQEIIGEHVYTHVGTELSLCVHSSPFLKQGINLKGFHSQETYLHLIDAYVSPKLPFRENAKRDVALVNKGCGMLRDELRIPECWYQLERKGLVRDSHGIWVKHKRDHEDIPRHYTEEDIPQFT